MDDAANGRLDSEGEPFRNGMAYGKEMEDEVSEPNDAQVIDRAQLDAVENVFGKG